MIVDFNDKKREENPYVVLVVKDGSVLLITEVDNSFIIKMKDTSIKSNRGDIYYNKYSAKGGVIKQIFLMPGQDIK